MHTERLKNSLAKLAAITEEIPRIEKQYAASGRDGEPCYPSMCGALQSVIIGASSDAAGALRWATDYIEPAEREAQRFVSIFESLGIDLDEETLSTLELIGKDKAYRAQQRNIRSAINTAVNDAQWLERDYEHDQAGEAIVAAGFVINDEDGETWTRGDERIVITLVSGRQARYAWEYGLTRFEGKDGVMTESGKSGEFHRLLALIAPAKTEEAPA